MTEKCALGAGLAPGVERGFARARPPSAPAALMKDTGAGGKAGPQPVLGAPFQPRAGLQASWGVGRAAWRLNRHLFPSLPGFSSLWEEQGWGRYQFLDLGWEKKSLVMNSLVNLGQSTYPCHRCATSKAFAENLKFQREKEKGGHCARGGGGRMCWGEAEAPHISKRTLSSSPHLARGFVKTSALPERKKSLSIPRRELEPPSPGGESPCTHSSPACWLTLAQLTQGKDTGLGAP